jgi:Polysaccharide deacetylase
MVKLVSLACALAFTLVAGCAPDDLADTDSSYDRWSHDRVLCGVGVDGDGISVHEIEAGMQRAMDRGEVLILFGHDPRHTIDPARVDRILGAADRAGLPFVTFPELADPAMANTPGFVLAFDDAYVDDWWSLRDVFRARAARVTFFVSNYGDIKPAGIAELHALAADGHAIEAHGMGHRDAPDFVDRHGLDKYLAQEIDPLLDAMHADGFTPTTFAYPYGDRTGELDAALLRRFKLLRSLTYLDRSLINSAPCPR